MSVTNTIKRIKSAQLCAHCMHDCVRVYVCLCVCVCVFICAYWATLDIAHVDGISIGDAAWKALRMTYKMPLAGKMILIFHFLYHKFWLRPSTLRPKMQTRSAINLCWATCEFMPTAIATTKCGGACAVSRGSDKFADRYLQWVRESAANAII